MVTVILLIGKANSGKKKGIINKPRR